MLRAAFRCGGSEGGTGVREEGRVRSTERSTERTTEQSTARWAMRSRERRAAKRFLNFAKKNAIIKARVKNASLTCF